MDNIMEKQEGLTFLQIIPIRDALVELSKKQSALGYQFAKNLNKANAEIKQAEEALQKSREALTEKDKQGHAVQYVARIDFIGVTQQLTVLKDDSGESRKLKKGETLVFPETPATIISPTEMDKWTQIQADFNNDIHHIEWHVIPDSRVEEVAKEEKIEGRLLMPLMGKIIV